MPTPARARSSGHRARSELRARLEARREEIEAAISTRVAAIADPGEIADVAYAEGLRRAVQAAIGHGLAAIDNCEGSEPPIPVHLLAQARLAARNRVDLGTVLRRYFAGYTLFGDFLVQEAGQRSQGNREVDLQPLLRSQAALFDRLIVAAADEYARERSSARLTPGQRRSRQIEQLLAGEPIPVTEIDYEFTAHHVGVVACGSEAEERLRDIAIHLDCGFLAIGREDGMVWAWLGGRRPFEVGVLRDRLGAATLGSICVGVGVPAEGLDGWRLSHRQALAALPIARQGVGVAHYADVALLACAQENELFTTSLCRLYLEPLGNGSAGLTLRETLRAYFAAERNSASAAAALGVTRQTVNNRLHAVETRIGRRLGECATELEVALGMTRLPK